MTDPTAKTVIHCPHCGTPISDIAIVRNALRLAAERVAVVPVTNFDRNPTLMMDGSNEAILMRLYTDALARWDEYRLAVIAAVIDAVKADSDGE